VVDRTNAMVVDMSKKRADMVVESWAASQVTAAA
jgi:hypothetical protein